MTTEGGGGWIRGVEGWPRRCRSGYPGWYPGLGGGGGWCCGEAAPAVEGNGIVAVDVGCRWLGLFFGYFRSGDTG